MKAEEIMKLEDVGQQLCLLKQNMSPLSDEEINKSIDFYLNEHPIKKDWNLRTTLETEKVLKSNLPTGYDPKDIKNYDTETYKKKHTKLCLPYAQQIVMTCSAFLIGKGINLVFHSDKEQDISSYSTFTGYWDKSNIISCLRKASDISSIETRCAILFFVSTDPNTHESKVKGKLLCKKTGYNIWRHKDENEKMDAVVVNYYRDKIVDGTLYQKVDTTEIYTQTNWYRYEGLTLQPGFPKENPKGTNKLLIAYFEQDYPEYWFVMGEISKQDYARSQHSDVNTRIGNPALVVNGKIATKPKINDAVKIFEVNPSEASLGDSKGSSTADMKYLEVKGAPESVKLELENNERDIYRFTYPDLYALIEKSISGNLSSKSITLMFTHVFAKIAEKRSEWDEMIKRCISIMKDIISAISGDSNVKNLNIDFSYNSILPSSTDDLVNMLSIAVGAHLTTYERAASQLDINDPQTVKMIKELWDNVQAVQQKNPDILKPKNQNVPNPDGVNG